MPDTVHLTIEAKPGNTRAWMREVSKFFDKYPRLGASLKPTVRQKWDAIGKRAQRSPSASYWSSEDANGFLIHLQDAEELSKILNTALDSFGQGHYFDPCRGICASSN